MSALSHALEALGCGISHRGDICRGDRTAQVHLQPRRISSNGGLDIAETVLYSDLVFVRDPFVVVVTVGILTEVRSGLLWSFVTVGISAGVGPFGLGLPTMTLVAGLRTDLLPDYKDVRCGFPTQPSWDSHDHMTRLWPLWLRFANDDLSGQTTNGFCYRTTNTWDVWRDFLTQVPEIPWSSPGRGLVRMISVAWTTNRFVIGLQTGRWDQACNT